MNSMIKKYMNENDAANSELFNKLHFKGNIAITTLLSSQAIGSNKRIHDELSNLLGSPMYQLIFRTKLNRMIHYQVHG